MALTTMFGLLFGTVLTMVMVPTLYATLYKDQGVIELIDAFTQQPVTQE
jgi:Cu/Ag efflux pump CusA